MSALTDRIAEVLLANSFGKFKDETGEGFSAYAAVVAEQVAEALQLTEEAAEIPTWSDTDEMVPNPMVQGPDMVPKRRLDFIPSRRWVSPWTAVENQPEETS